jgi:hypothetical protein
MAIRHAVVFLPLFSFLDTSATNATEMFCVAFDLLATAIGVGPRVETAFNGAMGFQILGTLLRAAKSFVLTYAVYARIYAVFAALTEPLQRSLLEGVINSFDLLATAPTHPHAVPHHKALDKHSASVVPASLRRGSAHPPRPVRHAALLL